MGSDLSDDTETSFDRFALGKDVDGIKNLPRVATNMASSNAVRQSYSVKAKERFASFQDVISDSWSEARRVQDGFANSSLLVDTIKEIGTAASQTIASIASIRDWSDNKTQKKEANDVWRFAASSRDEDDNTVGTYDTIQEDNNMIRRLGSWNTINTFETSATTGTTGTYDTGFNTQLRYEDDDGNAIDPKLIEKAQKARGKRRPRRKKLVKFDYPPVKQLRQYQRPAPEHLPNLFFTEHELEEIEGDRFSTMSTDDIEIVAVVSKETESKKKKAFDKDMRPTKERRSTPIRRRHSDDDKDVNTEDDKDVNTEDAKSPGKKGRLVKGVQIFLRERSTGE
jgi:hypothetical protein